MKTLKLTLLGAIGALALGGAAQAQEAESPVALSFNIGAASDYVFRGISQTNEDPEIYGGVDASIGSMGYAGVWASNVDFGNGTDAEIDVYGGIKPTLGPVSLDVGLVYYGYVGSPSGPDQAYWEGKVAASVPAGPATLGAVIYYSPEFFGETGKATYYEVNGSVSIPNTKLSLSAALGHQALEGPADYNTWNIGAGFALNDNIGFDLRYWDTDDDTLGDISKGRVVIGVKASF